jgi:hypothetical protein
VTTLKVMQSNFSYENKLMSSTPFSSGDQSAFRTYFSTEANITDNNKNMSATLGPAVQKSLGITASFNVKVKHIY